MNSRLARSIAGRALAVLLITVLLVVLNWSMISQVSTEVGDFAANSLLVQEAKRLALLDGHYSRFGFFHPGPAFLYVLAGGEWLFFDVTGLAGSALGGQLIAALTLTSVWLVLIFGLLRMVLSKWSVAVLGVVVFALVVTFTNTQFVNGLWFPLLYALPFSVFVLATSWLIAGRQLALPYVAFTGGVLINGHASFLVILPVVLAIALLAGFIVLRTRIAIDLRVGIWSGVILAIFLMPLAVRTIRDFPKPIADYFFSEPEGTGLGVSEAIEITSQPLGGTGIAILVILVLILLWVSNPGTATSELAVRGQVIGIVAATIATFIYALLAVDTVENVYLIYFAFALPALLALALLLGALNALPRAGESAIPTWIALSISGVLLAISLPPHGTGVYPADYNNPDIPAIAEAVDGTPRAGRLVLDLDSSEDWAAVWPPIMGVAAFLDRADTDAICIGLNWHIAFTERLRCSDEEIRQGRRLVVRPASSSRSGLIEVGGLTFSSPQ